MCANRTAHPRGPGIAPPSGPPPLSYTHCPTRSAHRPSSRTARLPSTAADGHADLTMLAAWLAAFLLVTALLSLFGDDLASLPLALRALVMSGVLMTVMTTVVMPAVSVAVGRWLAGPTRTGSPGAARRTRSGMSAVPEPGNEREPAGPRTRWPPLSRSAASGAAAPIAQRTVGLADATPAARRSRTAHARARPGRHQEQVPTRAIARQSPPRGTTSRRPCSNHETHALLLCLAGAGASAAHAAAPCSGRPGVLAEDGPASASPRATREPRRCAQRRSNVVLRKRELCASRDARPSTARPCLRSQPLAFVRLTSARRLRGRDVEGCSVRRGAAVFARPAGGASRESPRLRARTRHPGAQVLRR
jgi:hypothetical protein